MNILFDLGDTLHDKKASLHQYALFLWQNNASNIESDETNFIDFFITENSMIQPKRLVFEKLSAAFNIPQKLSQQLLNEFDKSFHEFAVPFENALLVLNFLKNNGVHIGCVTNGRDFFQKNKISALGFSPYFDVLVTSEAFCLKKPNLAIFEAALKSFDHRNEATCFCDDSLKADIKPAKALGLTTIWKSKETSKFADYHFERYSDFYRLWKNIEDSYKP